jgi:pimeloyl-ACP methyl ester carboxylesterase
MPATRLVCPVFSITTLVFCAGCLTNHAVGNHPEWRKLNATPEERGLPAEKVSFTSTDGIKLAGWWLHTEGESRAMVILAHGQGGNRSHMLGRAAFLVRAGYDVLAIDLRAHGESEGGYMTPGYMEAQDVLGAAAHVRERSPDRPIVLMGYSYGAVAVLHAAAQSNVPAAVVADAPFMSARDAMHRLADELAKDKSVPWTTRAAVGMVKWPGILELAAIEFYLRTGVSISPKRMDAIRAVPKIHEAPILFLAGEDDPIAPAANVRRLHDASRSRSKSYVLLPKATHNTYTDKTKGEYESAVLGFLDTVLAIRQEQNTDRDH